MTKALLIVASLLALTVLSCGFTDPPPTRIPPTPVPTLPPGAVVEELSIMNFPARRRNDQGGNDRYLDEQRQAAPHRHTHKPGGRASLRQ